jgi:hypothetical protein
MELAWVSTRTALTLIAPVTGRAQLWVLTIGANGTSSRADRTRPLASTIQRG